MIIGVDFDGTIANTRDAVLHCLGSVARADSEESILKLKSHSSTIEGKSLKDQLEMILVELDLDSAKKIFMEMYSTIGISKTSLIDGAKELFDFCHSSNIPIYVISAKSEINLVKSLDFLGLKPSGFVGSLSTSGKAREIRRLELRFYLGDQISDAIAAEIGGASPVLIDLDQKFSGDKFTTVKSLREFIGIISAEVF